MEKDKPEILDSNEDDEKIEKQDYIDKVEFDMELYGYI